jgi:conjugative transfer region protein (TIGR03748 family)
MLRKAIVLMALINALSIATARADEWVQTDRYTVVTVDPRGDQKAPLTAVVTLSFGTDIRSVGDAITELLNGSGYRWEKTEDDASLNMLPLPSVVRRLGPIRLNQALGRHGH